MDNDSEKLIVDKILKEKYHFMTEEDIRKMIDSELSKNSSETDYQLISELSKTISEMRNTNRADDITMKRCFDSISEKIEKKRSSSFRKYMSAAAAVCIILFSANTYTISAAGKDVFSFVFERNGVYHIDFSGKKGLQTEIETSEDDIYGIKKICSENNIHIETPNYIPDGFALTDLHTEDKYIVMIYEHKRQKISFSFSEYKGEVFGIPSDTKNFEETKVCGRDAVLVKEDKKMIFTMCSEESNLTIYTENVDYAECNKIIEGIG